MAPAGVASPHGSSSSSRLGRAPVLCVGRKLEPNTAPNSALRGFDTQLRLMGTRCTYEHRGNRVVCFVVTALGGLGSAAIKLISPLSHRGFGNSDALVEIELQLLMLKSSQLFGFQRSTKYNGF